jgi:hypothetical protein
MSIADYIEVLAVYDPEKAHALEAKLSAGTGVDEELHEALVEHDEYAAESLRLSLQLEEDNDRELFGGNEDGTNRDVPPYDNDPRTDREIKKAVYDRMMSEDGEWV